MPLRALSLAIVGADFANKRGPGRRFEIKVCKPGETVELRPEPKNKADPHAVAVFSVRDVQLGYVTAERAAMIGGMIGKGRLTAAIFQEPASYGCVVRIGIDGEIPILPPTSEHRYQDPDFWPDPIFPDE